MSDPSHGGESKLGPWGYLFLVVVAILLFGPLFDGCSAGIASGSARTYSQKTAIGWEIDTITALVFRALIVAAGFIALKLWQGRGGGGGAPH